MSADDAHDDHEPVGGVGEEAAKLFGALADLAREHSSDLGAGVSGLAAHATDALRDVDEHLATGAAECTWCPVCRTVHLVRQTSPEVRAHLGAAASSLLQAAAGLLATSVPDEARTRAGVERIDLTDGPDAVIRDTTREDDTDEDWAEDE